jgi:hypothetical protein
MPLPTEFWTIDPAGNRVLYSAYPSGVLPSLSWSTIPAYVNQTASLSVDLKATYLTFPAGNTITMSVNGTLPTGWSFAGTTLSYNGTSVNATPTSITVTATDTTIGMYTVSNSFAIQGSGAGSSDIVAPTIPTALAATGNSVSAGVTIGGFTPADPNPSGETATGLAQINVLRGGSALGVATIPSPGAPGNITTLLLTDLGGPFTPASTMTQSGADITVTTVALDPAYPTTDGQALPYQQISGTSWVAWCEIASFSPAAAYDNVNIQARPTLTDNAAYVGVGTHSFSGGVGVFSEARASTGAALANIQTVASTASPVWLFLVRAGDTYSMYYSLNVNTLLSLGSTTQVMGSSLYVGFPVNTNAGVSITVTIKQATIQTLGNWSYTDATVTPGDTYTYSATSQDTVPNVSAASPTISVTAASSTGVKWHPGHYTISNNIISASNPNTSNIQNEINLVLPNANVAGYMIIILASAIEGAEGVYSWTQVDYWRNYIATNYPTKRFGVMIWWENFSDTNPANTLPSYMLSNAGTFGAGYAGGSSSGYWQLGTYGVSAAWWRAAVAARIEAMFANMGAHVWSGAGNTGGWTYDTDPYVEAVTWQESALDLVSMPPDYTFAQAQTQWQNIQASIVASFPHTNVMDQNNFLGAGGTAIQTGNSVVTDAAARLAISSPDTQYGLTHWTWGQQAYIGAANGGTSGFTSLAGIAPSQMFVEDPDYAYGTQAQIMGTAIDAVTAGGLQASHVWWAIEDQGSNVAGDFVTVVLPSINATTIPTLNKTCPTNYSSCNVS